MYLQAFYLWVHTAHLSQTCVDGRCLIPNPLGNLLVDNR